MDTATLVFQGDRPTKGTVLASVLVFALAAGTIVIAAFLLISVLRDMSSVRTKRRLRELEPAVAKGLPKALTVRRNKTKSTLPGVSTRPTIFRTFDVRKNVSLNNSPVSADLTSTTTLPPKDPNARRSHTSYTSIWYPEGGELPESRVTHSIASHESISTYGGREESSTTSFNRSIDASTLSAAHDDREAPLPHEISPHGTSVNKAPRSVRTVNQNPAHFPSPSTGARKVSPEGAHSHSIHVPQDTTTTPPLVLSQSTTAAEFEGLKSSPPPDIEDLIATRRHKHHRHGQRPSIPKGTERTHKIHVVTTVRDKRSSASPHSMSSEPSTQMALNTSAEAIPQDRTSRADATVSSSSTEVNKNHRITRAASPASSSNGTHPIHVGSIPITNSDSTAADSGKDMRTTRATLSTMNVNREDPNADATNYSPSTEDATNASGKNETHLSHVGSKPHESTNLMETTLRNDLRTTEETYAATRDGHGTTERKSLESEEPFTEDNDADASKTTKHNHEAFRLHISRTPSSTRDRTHHSTHDSHVRRIRTSASPTTGTVEETRNGSQFRNVNAEASSTLYDKNGTLFQTAPSTLGTKFSSQSRTLGGDNDGSAEHSSHVFVGPGNWNELAKDDEDGHTHGHIPIPDPDGAKAATVGFPLDVFNRAL